jgi:hypothetical protein
MMFLSVFAMKNRSISKCFGFALGLTLLVWSGLASAKTPWDSLSPKQKELLEQVRPRWNGLSSTQQNRLIKMSDQYSKQDPSKQAVMRERIGKWSELSPKERAEIRKNYKLLSEESAKRGERNLNWNSYLSKQLEHTGDLSPPDPTVVGNDARNPAIHSMQP